MSWIYQGFYLHNPLLLWPIVAMVLFMVVFVASALRVWRFHEPKQDQHLSALPLLDDEVVSPEGVPHV